MSVFRRGKISEEHGMTVAEMLVAIAIFGILTTLAFTTVMNGSSNLKTVRQTSDLNEESRLVLNRISRELRQATLISSAPGFAPQNPDASNPDGTERICGSSAPPCFDPNADVSITFEVDFNGDGCIDGVGVSCAASSDPERLTYKYDRANRRLLLQAGGETTPILAGNVDAFKLSYRSSNYNCDVNSNGEVTWQEVETAPSPPCPAGAGVLVGGKSALDTELAVIDQVIIDMTVRTESREQRYRTKVDLRNKE